MGAGRPTKYNPDEHPALAKRLTLLGLTKEECSKAMDIGITTFERWMVDHDEFRGAIYEGRDVADANVAEALYKRAIGAQTYEERVIDGEVVGLVKTVPPDTQAASLWLRNRKPEKWRDKQEVAQDITSKGESINRPTHKFVD